MLLSPAGTTLKPHGAETQFLNDYTNSILKQNMIKLAVYLVFERKWSPFSLAFFLPKSYTVKKFIKRKQLEYKLDEKEMELMINYFIANFNYGEQGMSLLGYLLHWGNYSKLPSGIHFNETMTKYNTVVAFGENDWMKVEPVRELIEKLPENHKCEGIHIVKDAGHAMNTENAQGTNE